MPLNEFELIQRYFSVLDPENIHRAGASLNAATLTLGIGDDAAIVQLAENHELVFSIDTQLADVHFPSQANPEWIAQRAFRCAVSDLAAMGAEPLCFTLALTLPEADEAWLEPFSRGLKEAASSFHCPLVGGDTTKGPLSITLQVQGILPSGLALRRNGAKAGDVILISGYLGGATAYLQFLRETQNGQQAPAHAEELFRQDYFFPQARTELGKALRSYARSAIDISDGLLADLTHLCRASKLNAELQTDKIPYLPELAGVFGAERALRMALCGGDDYQLCFTAAENKLRKILSIGEDMECPITFVGRMVDTAFNPQAPLTCYDESGRVLDVSSWSPGYSHF